MSSYKGTTYAAAAKWLEESRVKYVPNPKRGKSFIRYAAYEKASTVGEALRLGSMPQDLLYDYERGFLEVSEPLRQVPLDLFAVKNFEELTYTDKVLARYAHFGDPSGQKLDEAKMMNLVESIQRQRANLKRLGKIQCATSLNIKDCDILADTTGNWETPLMSARRIVANQQAKEMLEALNAEGRKMTNFEVLQLLRLWDFRENVTRLNVMREGQTFVYSDTLGLVADRTGHIIAKEETKRYPEFGQALNRWLGDNLPADLGADFVCTSININKNYAGRLHRDGNNVGPSFLHAFGDFTGGQLNYFAEDDRSLKLEAIEETCSDERVKVDVGKGLLLFDGKRGHFVDDFEGERYSLVYFCCPRFENASEETRQYLDASGFPMPIAETMGKLTNVLRKPRGYSNGNQEEGAAASTSFHDAPFLFWPDNGPDRLRAEAQAEEFWKGRGLRERIEVYGPGQGTKRIQFEHRKDKYGMAWNEDHLFFVLPGEPVRQDLVLEGYKNMVDACSFLNAEDSKPSQAILDAGCCAIFSNRTKVWYCLFKKGMKQEALEAFGVETGCAKPKRGKAAIEEACEEEEMTPARKRKALASEDGGAPAGEAFSTKKQRRPVTQSAAMAQGEASAKAGTGAKEFKQGDLVEVQRAFESHNTRDGVSLTVGERGLIKHVDSDGDAQIYFLDHAAKLQWVLRRDFEKLRVLIVPAGEPKKTTPPVQQKVQRPAPVSDVMGLKQKDESTKPVNFAVFEVFAGCTGSTPINYKVNGKTATSHKGSYERYAVYSQATTLNQAMELGAKSADIIYDYLNGMLTIVSEGVAPADSAEGDGRFDKLARTWRRTVAKVHEEEAMATQN